MVLRQTFLRQVFGLSEGEEIARAIDASTAATDDDHQHVGALGIRVMDHEIAGIPLAGVRLMNVGTSAKTDQRAVATHGKCLCRRLIENAPAMPGSSRTNPQFAAPQSRTQRAGG
jgi:hypothetical protein